MSETCFSMHDMGEWKGMRIFLLASLDASYNLTEIKQACLAECQLHSRICKRICLLMKINALRETCYDAKGSGLALSMGLSQQDKTAFPRSYFFKSCFPMSATPEVQQMLQAPGRGPGGLL